MEYRKLSGRVLSPTFTYGASAYRLEVRPTQWKALMRMVWRWLQCEKDTKKLFRKEATYFGGVLPQKSLASPIGLYAYVEKEKQKFMPLVSHRSIKKKAYVSPTNFIFEFRSYVHMEKSLDWYIDLFYLSTLLAGVGKRSRRARGVITLEEMGSNNDLESFISHLESLMNTYSESPQPLFKREGDTIKSLLDDKGSVKYPVIEKVQLSSRKITCVDQFLKRVDRVSSEIKRTHKVGHFLSGKVGFRSSLIVTLVEARKGEIYPLYVFLRPVLDGRVLNIQSNKKQKDDRKCFVNLLEEN